MDQHLKKLLFKQTHFLIPQNSATLTNQLFKIFQYATLQCYSQYYVLFYIRTQKYSHSSRPFHKAQGTFFMHLLLDISHFFLILTNFYKQEKGFS